MNPIPPGWHTLVSTMSSIHRFKYDEENDDERLERPHQEQQPARCPHPVVFDTMIAVESLQRRPTPASNGNFRRQATIRNERGVEPQQYFIHSQNQSLPWTSNVKSFLQSARNHGNVDDNDALCWCEWQQKVYSIMNAIRCRRQLYFQSLYAYLYI